MPSRSVTSTTLMRLDAFLLMGSRREVELDEALGRGQRRRGHDVEIPGIGREIMRRPLDLEEDRHLEARAIAETGDAQRIVVAEPLELHAMLHAIAGDVAPHLLDHLADRALDRGLVGV